jgi:hypothetical protein
VAEFDPRVPSIARVYDYFLGGKDNFAADRDLADQMIAIAPLVPAITRENRQFLARAVAWAAKQGIGQFIDIGCGMPTTPNTLDSAREVIADARVAYVDNDPIVISHAQALLGGNPGTVVVQADIRDPARLIAQPTLRGMIDLDEPVAVLLIAVLHVIPEDDLATRIVEELRETIVPGSYIVLSHAVADLRPEVTARLAQLYQDKVDVTGKRRMNLRTKAEVEEYFTGLELVEPGVEYLNRWRPDPDDPGVGDTPVWSVGGIGRKV